MIKLRRYLKGYVRYFVLGPIFKLLEAVFELIVPLVMAKIIDVGIKNGDTDYILKMSGIIVILGICGLAFGLTCQYFAAKCGCGFGTALRKSLYEHINSLSHAEIDKIGTSKLITILTNDTSMAQQGVNWFIRLASRAPLLVIGATVMAMSLDLKLSVIFLIAAPLIAFIIYLVMSKSIPKYKENQHRLDRISLLTGENLEGARVIRAFSRQDEEKREFSEAAEEFSNNAIAISRISTILNPITFMIMNLAIVAIIWFGGMRVDNGILTQGEITAFVNYMSQILLALIALAHFVVLFNKSIASARRVNELFEIEPSLTDGEGTEPDYGMAAISFENVGFSYSKTGEPALEKISFEIGKGKTLGIIGGTGSGKSTIISLIPRFYEASDGCVRIFGKPVSEYKLDMLRGMIALVPQRAMLFSGTILENMRWGKADADENEVIEALKTAQAWEFVSKFPDGINTMIEQSGRNLSGGQRQRLTIARALVRKPEILILDDSMSALDYATDLAVRRALEEKMKDTTLIIVSQRATSLRNADKIIVMDDGNIRGIGTHDELAESCEVYREIIETQSEGNA